MELRSTIPILIARYTVLQSDSIKPLPVTSRRKLRWYDSWAGINELSRAADWSGILEMRKGALMDHNAETLRERMRQYCDRAVTFTELRARESARSLTQQCSTRRGHEPRSPRPGA